MAGYKYGEYLVQLNLTAYDTAHAPGSAAPRPGVYRCSVCGDEIALAKGHALPPQNHHQHAPGLGAIAWKLLVSAQSRG
jgi:hypothetical protein